MKKLIIILLISLIFLPIIFCGEGEKTSTNTNNNINNKLSTKTENTSNKNEKKIETKIITMATTTSTENSGLLAKLLPAFKETSGIEVKVVAVGTGAALKLGENGDVDVVLVHARPSEDAFVEAGFGVERRDVMYNDFIILGSEDDPAKVKESESAIDAFKRIAENEAEFISRGDNSGTHKKENIIWNEVEIKPEGKWYKEAGKGMGDVITMANQLQAYTLADRGTYLSMKDKINLEIVYEDDKILFNPYGIIAVNPDKHKHVKFGSVIKLIEWITSEDAQSLINSYTVDGEQLFYTYE